MNVPVGIYVLALAAILHCCFSAKNEACVRQARVKTDSKGNLQFVTQGNVTFRSGQGALKGEVTGVWLDGRLLKLPDTGPTGLQGPKGESGAKGSIGLGGSKGPKGEQGVPGVGGTNGANGGKGEKGSKGDRGQVGQKGGSGIQGIQGPKGTTGQKGELGVTGPQGPSGSKGQKGETGATGNNGKGDQGLTGATGAGGAAGIQGPPGAAGIQGPPGPQQLVAAIMACDHNAAGVVRFDPRYQSIAYCNGSLWLYVKGTPRFGSETLPGKHCADLKQKGVTTSGAYWIKPSATDPAFQTYCEMELDGGGWTLIIKMDGTQKTFAYDNSIWTEKKELNPSQVAALDSNECKLQSYWTLSFTEMRLGMQVSGTTHWITFSYTAPSLFSLTSTATYKATTLGRDKWKSLVGSQASLQSNCNQEGFNSIAATHRHEKVRIGIVTNKENNCNTADSRLGFGGYGEGCRAPASYRDTSCGNTVACVGDNGDKNIPATGFIMTR